MAVATCTLLYLSSCKKHHDAPIEVRFSAESLLWAQLPLNKYFIYKDSASGTLDSVAVTESKVANFFAPAAKDTMGGYWDMPAMNTESLTLLLSKFNGTSQEDWFYGKAVAFSRYSSNEGALFLSEQDRISNTNKGIAFIYQSVNPGAVSVTIEGKTYPNTLIFSYDNNYSPTQAAYHKRTYYWAKGIGIIKREIRTFNSVKTDLLVRHG